MRIYVANFGLGNYEWPECLKRGTIAVMNSPAHYKLWRARDRGGFIAAGLKHKTYKGDTPRREDVARWYDAADIFENSAGDIWIHRASGVIWWTISKPEPSWDDPESIEPQPSRRPTVVTHKPCEPWRNADRRGRKLAGAHLHPHDRYVFSNPQTVIELEGRNAAYALALINGDDLSRWRNDPAWYDKKTRKDRAASRREGKDSFEASFKRMVAQAFDTAAASNGQKVLRTVKNKKVVELTRGELERYLRELFKEQKGICKLTGLPLQTDSGSDDALRCSLDRIDSNSHYQKSNLQVVCKFANKWKNDSRNDEFLRLIQLLRQPAAG